jgi:hypothetical protein
MSMGRKGQARDVQLPLHGLKKNTTEKILGNI